MKTVIDILNQALPLPRGFYLRIENEPFMPLVLEGIGTGPRGQRAISIAHYYSQNGDAMRDPEMCFEVATNDAGEIVELFPYYFLNDGLGVEREGVTRDGSDAEGHPVYKTDQPEIERQIEFARLWDRNLEAQGFRSASRITR